MRHAHHVREASIVTPRDAFARDDFLWKYLQLFDQHRGLDGIESPCHADAHIVITIGPLPVIAQAADHVGEFILVGKDRAAIAVATERFRRKKTGGGDWRERAELAAFEIGAERLRGV